MAQNDSKDQNQALLRKITDVPHGCDNDVIIAKKLIDSPSLSWRFYNDQVVWHETKSALVIGDLKRLI